MHARHHATRVVATLAASFILLAAGLVAVLSQSAIRRTGTNRVRATAQLGALKAGQTLCQRGEIVPRGTGAIRASLPATEGHGSVRVTAIAAAGTTVARSAEAVTWSGPTLTVPLRPIVKRDTPARICITAAGDGLVGLAGEAAATGGGRASIGRRALHGQLRLVYLRPLAESWWASAGRMSRRLGAGYPLGGSTIAVLVALLALISAALASWQLARGDP